MICIKNIETSNSNRIQLDCIPKINGYDAIIFGAWVQAFNLCPGFNIYLKQLSDLEIKSVSCFLTQYFPYKWMGGSNALLKLSKLLKSKDIKVNFSGIINWSNKQRNAQIEALADLISSTYSG